AVRGVHQPAPKAEGPQGARKFAKGGRYHGKTCQDGDAAVGVGACLKGWGALPRRHCQRSRAFGCSAYRQSGTAEIHRRGPKMRPLQQLPSALVSSSQSWVLLAIPAFIFAGNLMERCGMSHALVELARAMVGWVRGGLGMSVIIVAYFFSDICGSKMAEVSALGSSLMPPLTKARYDRRDSASLIAAGTAMGMLVPPAIFMIVIAQVTNTSAVALFVAGFVPALVIMLCLMAVVYLRARICGWPVEAKPSLKRLGLASLHAAVPMVVPFIILAGFIFGVITATEAGAVVAAYAFLAAKLYYRNVNWREMGKIAYDSAILTAAVVF